MNLNYQVNYILEISKKKSILYSQIKKNKQIS